MLPEAVHDLDRDLLRRLRLLLLRCLAALSSNILQRPWKVMFRGGGLTASSGTASASRSPSGRGSTRAVRPPRP